MGKRSDGTFERKERDFYKTPLKAVRPLLPYLNPKTVYIEPCAGDGALIDHLASFGHIAYGASDIEPQRPDIDRLDAMKAQIDEADCFITNPPWDREILHPLIVYLSNQAPTWLLFDTDWLSTVQAAPFESRCVMHVPVGRVKWIEDSKHSGKDNCGWYLFDKPDRDRLPRFPFRKK